MGSAFSAGGGSPALTCDPVVAANAQLQQVKEQGAQFGIPEQMLVQAAIEGNSLEFIVSSYHQAKMAGELYIHTKQEQDLSHSPLARRMAAELVATHTSNNAAEPTGAKDEATHLHDAMAEAGIQ